MKSWDGKSKQMTSKNKRQNLFYAIYDNNDNYIAGFDKIRDIERGLGLKTGSLSRLCYNTKGEIIRIKDEQKYDCSQMFHCYTDKQISLGKYTVLEKGSKIYSFWEEAIEE